MQAQQASLRYNRCKVRSSIVGACIALLVLARGAAADVEAPVRLVTCPTGSTCRPIATDANGLFVVYEVVVSGLRGSRIFVHDTVAHTDRQVAAFESVPFTSPRITEDGRYILFANIAANARAYDTATSTLLNFDAVVREGVFHVAIDWSRDLRHVLYGVFRGDVRAGQIDRLFVHDRQSDAAQEIPLRDRTPVSRARLSPDGRYVSYTSSTAVWLFERVTGTEVRVVESLAASSAGLQARHFTSDARYLIAMGTTFETATGRAVVRVPDGSPSPNGRYIVYGCAEDPHDTTFCVYDQLTTWTSRQPPGYLSPMFFDSQRVAPRAVVDDLGRVALNDLVGAVSDTFMTCGSFFVPPPHIMFSGQGETSTVRLSLSSGGPCAWTARSNVPWITITSPASGNGSADLTYVVSSHAGGAPRTGTLTIAGQTFVITQSQNPEAPPGAPVALRASHREMGSLIWSPPVDGGVVTDYVVEGGSAAGLADRFRTSTAQTTSLPIVVPARGAPLYVRVRASNSFGTGIASNEVVLLVDPPSGLGCPFPPDATQGLTATVAGSTVTLGWSLARLIGTTFIIEAGAASGLANVANYVTGTSTQSLVVPDVPAGTYFVRVRGINVCGAGLSSNEIVVNVP